jgi:hypothetical protein
MPLTAGESARGGTKVGLGATSGSDPGHHVGYRSDRPASSSRASRAARCLLGLRDRRTRRGDSGRQCPGIVGERVTGCRRNDGSCTGRAKMMLAGARRVCPAIVSRSMRQDETGCE